MGSSHDGDRAGVERRIAALPCWGGPVEIMPLAGGITNRNYLVIDRNGRFVVRLGEDIPLHGVMRFNERAAAIAAHAAGLSPAVIHAGPGVLVSRFIEGRTLSPGDFRAAATRAAALALIRRCHTEIAPRLRGPSLVFWAFQTNRAYLGTLADWGGRMARHLPALAALNARLEGLVGPVTIVFGHNDLLGANLLDDGSRLWLLDWDYAGFNSPLFDLANLASNNGFSPAEEAELLEGYFGQAADAALIARFGAMKCASLLREALWSAVCEQTSTVEFDYRAYTEENFRRLDAAMAGWTTGGWTAGG